MLRRQRAADAEAERAAKEAARQEEIERRCAPLPLKATQHQQAIAGKRGRPGAESASKPGANEEGANEAGAYGPGDE